MIDNPMSTCSVRSRSHPDDQEQARAESSDDGPEGVGGVDPGHQPGSILSCRCGRRKRQGEARTPEERRGQQGPKRAREIQLEVEPDV